MQFRNLHFPKFFNNLPLISSSGIGINSCKSLLLIAEHISITSRYDPKCKKKNDTKSGQKDKVQQWLYEDMSFMLAYFQEVNTITNIRLEDLDTNDESNNNENNNVDDTLKIMLQNVQGLVKGKYVSQ